MPSTTWMDTTTRPRPQDRSRNDTIPTNLNQCAHIYRRLIT